MRHKGPVRVPDGVEPESLPPSARTMDPTTAARPSHAGELSTASLLGLQRRAGNAAVSRLLVQRHPVGAGMSVNPAKAMSEQARADAAPATETAPAAENAFVSWITGLFTKTVPPPAKPAYLDLATAQAVLEKTYGGVKKIGPGNIVFLESQDEAWKKYDELCVGLTNPKTQQPWKAGDAKATYPFGLNGFNWEGTSYINKESALSTTTPHEMLHGNTADGFRSAVGETLNEGCTQWLCLRALEESKIDPPANIPYAEEVAVAKVLIDTVGAEKVKAAYFNGGAAIAALIKAVDDARGDGTFAKAKAAGDKRQFAEAKMILMATGSTDLAAAGANVA